MKRRDFLRLSSTAAIAASGRVLRAASWTRRPTDLRLSVGFVEGELTDARSSSGDGRFLRDDAEVRVHGFHGPLHVDLDAIFGEGRRFYAASKNSAPARFTMPVDPIDGLQFELLVQSPEPMVIPLRFSVNSGAGSFPLRRGLYVAALHEPSSPLDWRAMQVTQDGILGTVDGSALLLSFDYARTE